jgi:2-keto-4-pentenoate hydratase/2-oxohepta-3-ene-1,7-dioic acid hydratase in catechol pathway
MKLVTFSLKECRTHRIGVVIGENRVIDLNAGYALYLKDVENELRATTLADALMPNSMLEFLDGGRKSIDRARATVKYVEELSQQRGLLLRDPSGMRVIYDMKEITLKAPIPRPRGIGIGFFNDPGIIEEAARAKDGSLKVSEGTKYPKKASILWGHPGCVVGPDEPIVYPKVCSERAPRVFAGLELGIVIGKTAYKVPLDKAKEHIAGYTIIVDVTAYDILAEDNALYMLTKVKNMPTFWPMGPWIVLADDVGDVNNLQLTVKINGQIKMIANTKTQIFDPYEYIRDLSEYMMLEPGTVIAMGSFRGTTIDCWIKPGDVLENEIQNIGILRNPVIPEA